LPGKKGRRTRAYITPDHGSNAQVPRVEQEKQASGARCSAFCGAGHFSGFSQQCGVSPAKHLGANSDCCVDLGLPEATVGATSVPQPLEQRGRAAVKILSQLAQRALGHFIDGELAGKISADSYKFDQRFDFGNFVRIENRIRTNFSRCSRSQQALYAPSIDSISARSKSEICVLCAASARPYVLSTGSASSLRRPRAESWIVLSNEPTAMPWPVRRSSRNSATILSSSAITMFTATP
jgi:hypothetical protein